MSDVYSISLIVPTYQRCASVQHLIDALSHQTLPPQEYEVIVSVDGSEDGTREHLAHVSVPYTLRTLWQSNRGRAAACNAGIRLAQGELLVILDDDMEPLPGFLEAHKRAHLGNTRLGVLGAVPVDLDTSSAPVVKFIGAKFNRHLEMLAEPGHEFKLRDFYTGNFSIRRDVLFQAGLFDESFTIYGNEDLELFVRLRNAGVQFVYSAEALAYQNYTKDFPTLARDNLAKGKTAVLLASKHKEYFHELKLGSLHQGSRKWRLLRAILVRLSYIVPRTPDLVIAVVAQLERRHAPQLQLSYTLSLDYFFWLGVGRALRENRRSGQGLTSLSIPLREGKL